MIADIVSIVFDTDYDQNRIKMSEEFEHMKVKYNIRRICRSRRHPDYVLKARWLMHIELLIDRT